MKYFIQILLLIASYIIGSIPFGLVFGKLKGVDIREHGSKNIGATNVGRVLGKKYFFFTFILDCMKGFIFVFLFRFNIIPHEYCLLNPMLYGLAAILGHVFSIFLKFKGGKAVSSSAGALLGYSPIIFLIAITIFIIIYLITKIISISSIITALSVIVLCIVFSLVKQEMFVNLFDVPTTNLWPLNLWFVICCIIIVGIIIIRHKSNIKRLANHTESKFILK